MIREEVLKIVANARAKGHQPTLRDADLREAKLSGAKLDGVIGLEGTE